MKHLNRRRLLLLCAAGVAMAAVVAAACNRKVLLQEAGRWLDVGERPTPVDWVFLLPGDLESRPFAAAALLTAGYADRILLPMNRDSLETSQGDVIPTHVALRRILLARGVPAAAIEILETESDSTFGDARALAAALQQHPGKRVALVTNDFHTRRTRWVFHNVLDGQVEPEQILVLGVPAERYGADDWWRTKEGFVIYASEYIKLAAYHCAYGSALWWLGGGIFALSGVTWYAGRRSRRHRQPSVAPPGEPAATSA